MKKPQISIKKFNKIKILNLTKFPQNSKFGDFFQKKYISINAEILKSNEFEKFIRAFSKFALSSLNKKVLQNFCFQFYIR